MAGKQMVMVLQAETASGLNFEELCHACHAMPEFVLELVQYGTLDPVGHSLETWRFDGRDIHVLRIAMHLHHDLELNHAGIALTVELMDEIAELREQVDMLQKYSRVPSILL